MSQAENTADQNNNAYLPWSQIRVTETDIVFTITLTTHPLLKLSAILCSIGLRSGDTSFMCVVRPCVKCMS
jgi:hypothetical protein